MFWSLWNSIPWYVPIILIIIALGFAWQWIAPLWFMLPRSLQIGIGFVVALIVAVQYGRNRGKQTERDNQRKLDATAIATRDKINEQVKAMPPNAVSDALRRNGWMRD